MASIKELEKMTEQELKAYKAELYKEIGRVRTCLNNKKKTQLSSNIVERQKKESPS